MKHNIFLVVLIFAMGFITVQLTGCTSTTEDESNILVFESHTKTYMTNQLGVAFDERDHTLVCQNTSVTEGTCRVSSESNGSEVTFMCDTSECTLGDVSWSE